MAAPEVSDTLQQILWTDWLDGYWVQTISMFEPIIFVRLDLKGQGRKIARGEQILTTSYVQGEDGFTYLLYKPGFLAEQELVPIYTLKKGI